MTELERQARAILGLGEDDPVVTRGADGVAEIRWNGIRPQRVMMAVEMFEDCMGLLVKAERS